MQTKVAPPPKRPGPSSAAVYTLGQFRIEVDGKPLRFGQKAQRKPLDLLKLLIALGGNSIPVETLIDSLWADSDGDQAQGAFSTALHRLRKLIGYEALLLADSRLTLNPESCWVDARAFPERLDQAIRGMDVGDGAQVWKHLEAALDLYRGPFLEGEFDLPEIMTARERQHGLFLRNIGQLGEFLSQNGELSKAIVLYQRGLEIDELAEEIYQKLMLGYQQLGRYAEGISVYQRLQKVFKAGAGIKPSQETDAIYRALTSPDVKQPEPVSAGSVSPGGISLDPPDQPSIAVLPFENMSGDSDQEYFSDGLTEDIITDLSYLPGLFVIASNSTYTYKGKSVTTQLVGKEMGVRYVLKGSVRKSGGVVRITAQLIEAATGHHLWARRYDRVLEDVFTVQDELTEEIVTTLDVKLVQGESGRYYRRGLKNPEAREAFYRGRAHHEKMTRPDVLEARKYFEKVMELEPDSPLGYANACYYYHLDYLLHWFGGEGDSLKKLIELVKKALALDENDPTAYSMLGRYHLYMKEHDLAIEASEKATMLGPSLTLVWRNLGWIQMWNESPHSAIETLRSAMRFSPIFHPITASQLGSALRNDGQMEIAESTLKSALGILPGFNAARVILATIYGMEGRNEEAKAEVRELLRIDPAYTVTKYATPNLYRNPDYMEQWLDPLRKAGLPE